MFQALVIIYYLLSISLIFYCFIKKNQISRKILGLLFFPESLAVIAFFGKNLTGWVEIKLRTTEKTTKKVWARIQYVERVKWGDLPDGEHIGSYVDGEFQTDHIYLRPEPGLTTWHPHFTYHGFRYACVTIDDYSVAIDQPTTTIESIEACFIHNDFRQTGSFTTSNQNLD